MALRECWEGWIFSDDAEIKIRKARNGFSLRRKRKGKRLAERKTIKEIDAASASQFQPIGDAEGYSVDFCIFLGFKHVKEFFEQVAVYVVGRPSGSSDNVVVSFYAKKN